MAELVRVSPAGADRILRAVRAERAPLGRLAFRELAACRVARTIALARESRRDYAGALTELRRAEDHEFRACVAAGRPTVPKATPSVLTARERSQAAERFVADFLKERERPQTPPWWLPVLMLGLAALVVYLAVRVMR